MGLSQTVGALETLAPDDGQGGATRLAPEHAGQPVAVPWPFLGGADFERAGGDLVVEIPDGPRFVIEGWFDGFERLPLVSENGQVLTPDVVERLAGPLAPGQVAQLDLGAVPPVGRVDTIEGSVQALRADGTVALLEVGAPVYAGDVLESGPGAAAGVTLVDGTTLAMAENARLVLDDVIYGGGDADTLSISVLNGVFTLSSGQIAADDPTAMLIESPSAVAGVRGTRVGIQVDENGETWFLVPDQTGHVGSYQLTLKLTGDSLLMTEAFQSVTADGGTLRLIAMTPEAIADVLGDALRMEPENETRAENVEPDAEELARLAAALAAIAPAAGPEGADVGDGLVQTVLGPTVWSFLANPLTGQVLAFSITSPTGLGGDHRGESEGSSDRDNDVGQGGFVQDPIVRLGDGGVLFIGGDGPDTVIGGAGADQIFGGGGDDVLDGGAGGDTLDGGPGDDAVFGGTGDDLIIGGSGEGDDLLVGGPGADTVRYSSANQAITVDLAAGRADGDPAIGVDSLAGIEHVIGGAGDDTLRGNGAANSLTGGAGDDILEGRGGNDALLGGEGFDTVVFGGPSDRFLVGPDGATVTITDTTGALGSDTLAGVETATFGDRTLIFNGVNDAPVVGGVADVEATIVRTLFAHDFGDVPPADAIDPEAPNGVPADALTFEHDHTVTVTFLQASTEFVNAMGAYTVAADGTIGAVNLFFPNASEGALEPGVDTATFDVAAGQRIGLFVVADGAVLNDFAALGPGAFAFLAADGSPATIETAVPRLVFRGSDGSVTEIQSRVDEGIVHSITENQNPDAAVHVASGLTTDGGLVVAFEVQPDEIDFNDLIVRIDVADAVETDFDPVALVPAAELSDVDGVALSKVGIVLEGAGGDRLEIDQGLAAILGLQVTQTGDGFDIAGLGSFADYEAVLATMVLANDNPTAGGRTVSLTVFDSAGAVTNVDIGVDIDETILPGGGEGFIVFADANEGFVLADVG